MSNGSSRGFMVNLIVHEEMNHGLWFNIFVFSSLLLGYVLGILMRFWSKTKNVRGAALRRESQMDGFWQALDRCGLGDLGYVGLCFTW